MRLALVTAIAAHALDEDLAPLFAACTRVGLAPQVLAWDDPTVSWARHDAAILRSPWDYSERLPEFLAWCARVDRVTTLLNPLPVLRWNTDKHYLADLAAADVPVVASSFVEPDSDPLAAVQDFLSTHADAPEFVVKPAVSAGARDTQRYARAQVFAAANQVGRLLEAGRSVLLQPYLASVDAEGETALMYFDGAFSHAIRKGPLLRPDADATDALFAAEAITVRTPGDDEHAVAEAALAAMTRRLGLERALPYARIDLIRAPDGQPQLLELELTEPSLFFAHEEGSADRFATMLAARLRAMRAPGRAVNA